MTPLFENKTVLITGGTGSLGQTLARRILSGEEGTPKRLVIFSRDECKQDAMRQEYSRLGLTAGDIANRVHSGVQFIIGDVRRYADVEAAVSRADVIVNAAALKQVPSCEYFPEQAVRTNCLGPANLVRAVRKSGRRQVVVGVSTDKACMPVNVMGMTKAIQERIFIEGNLQCPDATFVCVRYGNVLASRGSVVPLFKQQVLAGGPVTVTSEEMTRFLLPLDRAVDTIFAAVRHGLRGQTWVPAVLSARVMDIARAMVGTRRVSIEVTGVRPGEKLHETLISEEEAGRAVKLSSYWAIQSMLPELYSVQGGSGLSGPYTSQRDVMTPNEVQMMLQLNGLLPDAEA